MRCSNISARSTTRAPPTAVRPSTPNSCNSARTRAGDATSSSSSFKRWKKRSSFFVIRRSPSLSSVIASFSSTPSLPAISGTASVGTSNSKVTSVQTPASLTSTTSSNPSSRKLSANASANQRNKLNWRFSLPHPLDSVAENTVVPNVTMTPFPHNPPPIPAATATVESTSTRTASNPPRTSLNRSGTQNRTLAGIPLATSSAKFSAQ
mmetsp:Transcript_41962/g.105842  ORF Transcript_41962/g.105842 Transcript_41962/m.105842 type:complete len:208 (-) Transcript_41962:1294-1917(-)